MVLLEFSHWVLHLVLVQPFETNTHILLAHLQHPELVQLARLLISVQQLVIVQEAYSHWVMYVVLVLQPFETNTHILLAHLQHAELVQLARLLIMVQQHLGQLV